MGLIKAFSDSVKGTLADQWKEIITAGSFDEHVVVSPGILQSINNGRGTNLAGSNGIITNGSKIHIPENTAAFIFSEAGIEEIITDPGEYEYQNGSESLFNGDGVGQAIFNQVKTRLAYGGVPVENKKIAFINLREIRDIKFGTRGPQLYNDLFYNADLEVFAYGSFTVKITDPTIFVKNFLPANVTTYSFDDKKVRSQLLSEFLQSFNVALNSLSGTYRISQLPGQANKLSEVVTADSHNAGTWPERFGISIIHVSIENIEFTESSRELVKQYSTNKMNLRAYEDVSQRAANIAAQQKIAQGIQDNGLGDMGGMIFGTNIAGSLGNQAQPVQDVSFDKQIEMLKKLKDLLDAGILTQEEFDTKKKEIMGL